MTHREFNNLSARRNLSSFIPARNQNIRPPRTSARINLSTYVPISRQINEPVNTENSIKNYFKPAHVPWNTGLKGVKLKPDKNVFQYSAYTGEFIKEWNTAKEAGQTLNINDNGIGHCCRGKAKSAGGYIWKYYKQEKIEIMNNVKLKIKRVC